MRQVVTREDGETIDLPIAEAESYDSNANLKIALSIGDSFIQRMALVSGSNWKTEYIGYAKPGSSSSSSVWQIKKLIYTGDSVTAILFANGDTKFDKIWDNRTSYSYS